MSCSVERLTYHIAKLLSSHLLLNHPLSYLLDLVLIVGMVGVMPIQEIELRVASFIQLDPLLKLRT